MMKRLFAVLMLLLSVQLVQAATITIVQKLPSQVGAVAGGSNQSAAFATNPTLGDRIIATVATVNNNAGVVSIADTSGNTWTVDCRLVQENSSANNWETSVVFSAPVTVTGANFKITVSIATPSGAGTVFNAMEVSGVATSSYLDKCATHGALQDTTTLTVGPTAALSTTGELIVADLAAESSQTSNGATNPASVTGPTLSTASTSLAVSQDFSSIQGAQQSYAIASTTGATSVNWSYNTDSATYSQYVGLVATYIPASSSSSCTHAGYTAAGALTVPNGTSGSYVGKTGALVTPTCASGGPLYWQPLLGNFGFN